MELTRWRRVRWAVRATLILGVAASVAANILHARDNPISQTIAAWPPVALLLTVELISRVPVHRRSLAAARLLSTATIAGIAGWVSYWHMAGVAAKYGETGASPYLLPISVDGLIVVASICLVELSGRISAADNQPAHAPPPTAAALAPHRHPDGQPAPVTTAIRTPPHPLPAIRTSSEQPDHAPAPHTTAAANPDRIRTPVRSSAPSDTSPQRAASGTATLTAERPSAPSGSTPPDRAPAPDPDALRPDPRPDPVHPDAAANTTVSPTSRSNQERIDAATDNPQSTRRSIHATTATPANRSPERPRRNSARTRGRRHLESGHGPVHPGAGLPHARRNGARR
jgi:hypothetical protein